MRSIRFLALLILSGLLAGCAAGPRLAGDWVLVERSGRDLGVPDAPRPGDVIKRLDGDRFEFGSLAADGRLEGGGAGAWYYEEGRYHEVVRFHDHPVLVGEDLSFVCELDGRYWRHNAQFVAKGERYDIDEVWRRLETDPLAED